MSDLAPFVAASLRDKVVSEMHQEILRLRQELFLQQEASQLVTITGPMGSPVYARANFVQHGKFDASPELWKVEFPTNSNHSAATTSSTVDHHEEDDCSQHNSSPLLLSVCTLAALAEMEVRIGGIVKAKLESDIMAVEGFINNTNDTSDSGTLFLWFGGSSGIWLTLQIMGMDKQDHAALREMDLSGSRNLFGALQQFCSLETQIEFSEVSFLISHMNSAMEAWGIPTEPPEVLPPPTRT